MTRWRVSAGCGAGHVWGDVSDPTALRPALVLVEAIKRGDPAAEEMIAGVLLDDSENMVVLGAALLDAFECRHRRPPAFIDLAALRREPV